MSPIQHRATHSRRVREAAIVACFAIVLAGCGGGSPGPSWTYASQAPLASGAGSAAPSAAPSAGPSTAPSTAPSAASAEPSQPPSSISPNQDAAATGP
jgi:hypothetical protein